MFPRTIVKSEFESKAVPVEVWEQFAPKAEALDSPATPPPTINEKVKTLNDYWSNFHNALLCYECRPGPCTCADKHKEQLTSERAKLVNTLNNLWSSPLTDMAKLTDEQLDKKYVPDGVCLDCRAVQQEYIDHGKAEIPKDATLGEYTDRVAELKANSRTWFCPTHGGYDPIVMEKVYLD